MRLLTVLAALVGLAPPRRAAGEVPGLPGRPGNPIIVGGGDTPMAVQQRFVASPGARKARIAVFPMASTQFDEEAREVMAELRKLHADPQLINPIARTPRRRHRPSCSEAFTGYWFLGGDQNRLAATLLGTRALDVIERRYREARSWAERPPAPR